MTSSERYDRVMELFDAAVELATRDRDAFLERECGSDAELLREVRALLEYDRTSAVDAAVSGGAAEALVAEVAGRMEPSDAAMADVPERIGPYRILRAIGSGGMGVIYEAEQDSPRRGVALKVIRPGRFGPDAVRRLRREAEVLGRLRHPNIAQVFDAGFTDAASGRRPYFVMELVDGVPLDRYARDRGLSQRECMELFVEVCDAVHHAHQRGIIHRDLKPANILVEAPRDGGASIGRPKVLDFGIARVVDADDASMTYDTQVGHVVGTMAYMSPEQLMGDSRDLDTRCDVYALGVILHELWLGERPHDLRGLSIVAAARVVSERTPARAGKIDPSLRGDAEAILMRALETDRARRYASAAALAADLKRSLAHEPIEARPTTVRYQISKFVRRHRAVATTASIAVIAGIGLTIWALVNAGTARENARLAVERERELGRLSDGRELRVLQERMDSLWPLAPDRAVAIDAWLDEAHTLVSRIPEHESTLARLERSHASEASDHDPAAEAKVRWWHETLERLLDDLRAFAGPERFGGTIAAMKHRRDIVGRMETLASSDAVRQDWAEARKEVMEDPRYRRLDLLPQVGLVPIGRDPESGLQEFWHVSSGRRPERDPDSGKATVGPETGIVLVLLPGGEGSIGSSAEPDHPRYAADAFSNEVPPVPVALHPFFCSKYEVTQGQWERVTGDPPKPGLRGSDGDYRAYPVILVDWTQTMEVARRYGMELLTEVQWEYACRAGGDTPWSCGRDASCLWDHANLGDLALQPILRTQFSPEPWNDGHFATAPVGSFLPNAFGIHDMHGNVVEWCRDTYHASYEDGPFDPVDGFRGPNALHADIRIVRGGGYLGPARYARSAVRARFPLDHKDDSAGVRFARRIERPTDG